MFININNDKYDDIIASLAVEYNTIWYINMETENMMLIYHSEINDVMNDAVKSAVDLGYYDGLKAYISNYVVPEEQEKTISDTHLDKVRTALSQEYTYTVNFRRIVNNEIRWYQISYIKNQLNESDVIIAFRDINAMVIRENEIQAKIRSDFVKISMLASQYETLIFVNLETMVFSKFLYINNSPVNSPVTNHGVYENESEFTDSFSTSLKKYTHPDHINDMLKYADTEYLKEILKDTRCHEHVFLCKTPSGNYEWTKLIIMKFAKASEPARNIAIAYYNVDAETREKMEMAESLKKKEAEKIRQQLEEKKKNDIIASMSNIWYCSYYIDLADESFIELACKLPNVKKIIGESGNARVKFAEMCKFMTLPQYAAGLREFSDFSDIDNKLAGKEAVFFQFEGPVTGWIEAAYIAGDRDENGKLRHVIWAIRSLADQKAYEKSLMYNSYIDELTGLYNRKMYMEDIPDFRNSMNSLVYVSMDVNELKTVNDSLGHAAGDELLKGAALCMKECFSKYGKIYRMGGDEFTAILYITPEKYAETEKRFFSELSSWKGEFVEKISVSLGSVIVKEHPELSFAEIETTADKNMYRHKTEYYRTRGIDRRGHQKAVKALCSLYNKILSINLTDDSYSIVYVDESEKNDSYGFPERISELINNFASKGYVHPDDVQNYLELTDKEYMIKYFDEGHKMLSVKYRRKFDNEFRDAAMDIIPSADYSHENRILYLYVRYI